MAGKYFFYAVLFKRCHSILFCLDPYFFNRSGTLNHPFYRIGSYDKLMNRNAAPVPGLIAFVTAMGPAKSNIVRMGNINF